MRYGMVLDLDKCIGCYTCVVACKMLYGTRLGVDYNGVEVVEWGEYPNARQRFVLTMCMHCENVACVSVCPTEATYTTEEGVVLVDYDKCIGCGACVTACPYGQRHLVKDDVTSFEGVVLPFEEEAAERLNVVEKCVFCYGRVKSGKQPMCTVHCPGQCRIFGDLDDPESEVSKYIKENNAVQIKGTSIYYVLPEGMDRSLLPKDNVVYAAAVNTQENKVEESKEVAEEKRGINKGAVAVGIIGAGAVLGGAVYKMSKDKSKKDNNDEEMKGGDK